MEAKIKEVDILTDDEVAGEQEKYTMAEEMKGRNEELKQTDDTKGH